MYLAVLNAASATEQRAKVAVRLPCWIPDSELWPAMGRTDVDELARSTGRERRHLEAEDSVALTCSELEPTIQGLASSRKAPETTKLYQLLATIGIERWDQRPGGLAKALGKHPDGISRWDPRGCREEVTGR